MTLRELIPGAPPGLISKPNKDGTVRVYLQAPKDRPPSIPATTPLPFTNRTGRLDAEELAAIRRDGWAVWQEIESARKMALTTGAPAVTWAQLADLWGASSAFKALAPVTQRFYVYWARRVAYDLDSRPDYGPQRINQSGVDRYLQTQVTKGNVPRAFTVIRAMLNKAARDGFRPPVALELGFKKPRLNPRPIWERSDLDEYEAGIDASGDTAIAGIIVTAMELAQRVGDVREFRMGKHYWADGWFRFHQSKTTAYVSFPAPPRVQARLQQLNLKPGDPLFPNPRSGAPYTNVQLVHRFGYLRGRLLTEGRVTNNRMLQTLRHSGVVELARAGCTLAEIGSLTGHSYTNIEEMMELYMRRDSVCAANAIGRREGWRRTTELGESRIVIDGRERFILPAPPTLH